MNNYCPITQEAQKINVVARRPNFSMKHGSTNGTRVLESALHEKNRLNYASLIVRNCSISVYSGDCEFPQKEFP